jgi:hypothetical protein
MYACPEAVEFELKCSLAIRAPYAHAVFHGTTGRQSHTIRTLWNNVPTGQVHCRGFARTF